MPWPGCQGGEDPGPLICLVPADPSPSMTAAPFFGVYGVSLATHLQDLGRDIALPIEACVMMLLSEGMKEEVGPTGAGRAGALGPSLCPQFPPAAPCWCCHPTIRAQAPPLEATASCCQTDTSSHLGMLVKQPLCCKAFTFLDPFSNPRNPCREPSPAPFYKGRDGGHKENVPRGTREGGSKAWDPRAVPTAGGPHPSGAPGCR